MVVLVQMLRAANLVGERFSLDAPHPDRPTTSVALHSGSRLRQTFFLFSAATYDVLSAAEDLHAPLRRVYRVPIRPVARTLRDLAAIFERTMRPAKLCGSRPTPRPSAAFHRCRRH
jgi:hypothetical protein